MSTNNNSKKNGRHSRKQVNPAWEVLQKLTAPGEDGKPQNTEVEVVSVNKNNKGRVCGLNIRKEGIDGFLPGSELPRNVNQDDLVGKTLVVRVLEADPFKKGGRLLVSRKAVVLDAQRAYIDGLHKGEPVKGTVVSVALLKEGTGYFVRIGEGDAAVEALLHGMQVPRKKGETQTFAVGDSIEAWILGKNSEACKVSLTKRVDRIEKPNDETGSSSRNGRGRRGGNGRSKGTPKAQHATERDTSKGQDSTSTPPAAKQPTTPRPQSKPKALPSAPKPLRTGRRDGFTQSFRDFASLAAWFKENHGEAAAKGEQAPVTEQAASDAGAQPAAQ